MPPAPKKRRRTPRQLLRGVRRRTRRAAGRVRRVFWRSLQLRVVTSTMVISIVVVVVLGVFLMQQIVRATLETRESAAKSEAQADRNAVLGYLNQPAEAAKQPVEPGQVLQPGERPAQPGHRGARAAGRVRQPLLGDHP